MRSHLTSPIVTNCDVFVHVTLFHNKCPLSNLKNPKLFWMLLRQFAENNLKISTVSDVCREEFYRNLWRKYVPIWLKWRLPWKREHFINRPVFKNLWLYFRQCTFVYLETLKISFLEAAKDAFDCGYKFLLISQKPDGRYSGENFPR